MRFYINILTTYFPDLDPPYDLYYRQILEQIELAEELGWECFMFNEHHFLGYGGLVPNPAVLLAAGRNLYGSPEECVKLIGNAMRHYYFDTLTTTFNFGGIPHEAILKSMRLFAREVMPAFR